MSLKITTLIENTPSQNPALSNEHGLSLYIETEDIKILFDTGQSGAFIGNAEILQKDLTTLDYMIISHGHFDHSGGVHKVLDILGKQTNMIVGSEFFVKKYKDMQDGTYFFAGNSNTEESIAAKDIKLTKLAAEMIYLTDHVVLFHHFPYHSSFEHPNPYFVVEEKEGYTLDLFSDEIALGIITEKGLVVIVGCSHAGIVNILSEIEKKMNMHIHAVIGGTHLVDADEDRIQKTMEYFDEKKIEVVAVSHCTGEKACALLSEHYGKKFIVNNTGNVMEF